VLVFSSSSLGSVLLRVKLAQVELGEPMEVALFSFGLGPGSETAGCHHQHLLACSDCYGNSRCFFLVQVVMPVQESRLIGTSRKSVNLAADPETAMRQS
jgi:hypothetical protein